MEFAVGQKIEYTDPVTGEVQLGYIESLNALGQPGTLYLRLVENRTYAKEIVRERVLRKVLVQPKFHSHVRIL